MANLMVNHKEGDLCQITSRWSNAKITNEWFMWICDYQGGKSMLMW